MCWRVQATNDGQEYWRNVVPSDRSQREIFSDERHLVVFTDHDGDVKPRSPMMQLQRAPCSGEAAGH
jgi:hypothetical protein